MTGGTAAPYRPLRATIIAGLVYLAGVGCQGTVEPIAARPVVRRSAAGRKLVKHQVVHQFENSVVSQCAVSKDHE